MPQISGQGWELLIRRVREEYRGSRRRTVGSYQVFHDGQRVRGLSGECCETRGPGDNTRENNGRRIEEGIYPLYTQNGRKYKTIGYSESRNSAAIPRPGIELMKTNQRTEILIHPGRGFLSSIGCINPSDGVAHAYENLNYVESRRRTIALIEDLKAYLGAKFPGRNGRRIPQASVVVDGEPAPAPANRLMAHNFDLASIETRGLRARITKATFHQFASRPSAGRRQAIYDAYIDAFTSRAGADVLNRYGVSNNLVRLVHFFAQAAHETGDFTIVRESLTYTTVRRIRQVWPSRARQHTDDWIRQNLIRKPVALGDWAYGGRMGNRRGTDDGYNYRGGGTFQTTGKNQYRAKGALAGVDLVAQPELIEDPQISLLAACAEWGDLGCNRLADRGEIEKISRGINRGNINSRHPANGEEDRKKKFRKLYNIVMAVG